VNIPRKVKVGGYTLKVKHVNMIDGGDTGGSFSFGTNIIQLARQTMHVVLGKKKKTRISVVCREEFFLHELLHGIDQFYNGDTLTEKQVENLAKGLHQVIVDNPEMFEKGKGSNENTPKD
jgi:hypothetical protein